MAFNYIYYIVYYSQNFLITTNHLVNNNNLETDRLL